LADQAGSLPKYGEGGIALIKSIEVTRFAAGSLFKIVTVGCGISTFGFAVLMGVLALFGAHTVRMNQDYVTGLGGFLLSLVIGLVIAAISTIFAWLGFLFGFWVFSRFRSLRIDYISSDEDALNN
jgi:hypothetical protein